MKIILIQIIVIISAICYAIIVFPLSAVMALIDKLTGRKAYYDYLES